MKRYLAFLNSSWIQLSNLGTEQQSKQLRKRIILTNKYSLTLFLICVVFAIAWAFAGTFEAVILNVVCAFSYFSIPWLNSRGYIHLTRFFILGSLNVIFLFVVGAIGTKAESQTSFYALIGLPFLLFEAKEKKCIILGILIPISFFTVLAMNDFHLFEFAVAKNILTPFGTYFVNFLFLVLSMFYLHHETEKSEEELQITNEKLLSSQIFLKSIIENIPLDFYARDLENRYTIVNPEFEKTFKIKANDVLQKTNFDVFTNKVNDFLALHDREVLEENTSKTFESSIILDEDQKEKTYLCTKFPIRDPRGEAFGVCSISTDITARVEAQKKLDEQKALIVNNIRLSALGEMANGMSHEINNPLATIELAHGRLKRLINSTGASLDDQNELLQKIELNTERITEIVAALRKFIGESGAAKFEMVDLNEIISGTLGLCQEKFKQRGISLEVHVFGSAFPLHCRPEGVRQVIYSLLTNAFDAVENTKDPTVQINIEYLEDKARILVSDSGPGIPNELLNKIFQPFFTTKEVGKGRGLGLSISKGIIDSQGGLLFLDRTKKRTTFVIELSKDELLTSDRSKP